MQTIQLTLALAEVNQILEALGERPYRQVYELIGKIQEQSAGQLQLDAAQQPDSVGLTAERPATG